MIDAPPPCSAAWRARHDAAGPLDACIAALACEVADNARDWADHCLTPMQRYHAQLSILGKHLDRVAALSGYAEALWCASYVLQPDGGGERSVISPEEQNMAEHVVHEIMCPTHGRGVNCSAGVDVKDVAEHHTLNETVSRSDRMVLAPSSLQSYYAQHGLQRDTTLLHHGTNRHGRRSQPLYLLRCADCNRIATSLGPAGMRLARALDAPPGQFGPPGAWAHAHVSKLGRGTWNHRFSAQWDLHPFGMWLGGWARRQGQSLATTMAACVDFTMNDAHLTAIVHGFSWTRMAQLADATPAPTDTGAAAAAPPAPTDTATAGAAGGAAAASALDGPIASVAAVRVAREVLEACRVVNEIQPKWLQHCAHGIGHGVHSLLGLARGVFFLDPLPLSSSTCGKQMTGR